MPILKILGKRIGGPKEEDFKKRISSDNNLGPDFRVPNRMARQDFSEMTSKGPDMGKVNKITKKEVTVETPEGEYGSVNRVDNPEAVGPDLSKVYKEEPRSQWTDPHEQARKMMGFKKGGKVKSKCMSSGGKISSASKRADGIATKGKTRGRII